MLCRCERRCHCLPPLPLRCHCSPPLPLPSMPSCIHKWCMFSAMCSQPGRQSMTTTSAAIAHHRGLPTGLPAGSATLPWITESAAKIYFFYEMTHAEDSRLGKATKRQQKHMPCNHGCGLRLYSANLATCLFRRCGRPWLGKARSPGGGAQGPVEYV